MWAGQDELGFASWPDRDSWTPAPDMKGVEFSTFASGRVYSRTYDAGQTIELYGNEGAGAGSYLVFVCPLDRRSTATTSSTKLTVTAHQGFSYGVAPLVFSSGESYLPSTVQSGTYQDLACAPKEVAAALSLNADNGELTWDSSGATGGLTFSQGGVFNSTSGGICQLSQGGAETKHSQQSTACHAHSEYRTYLAATEVSRQPSSRSSRRSGSHSTMAMVARCVSLWGRLHLF